MTTPKAEQIWKWIAGSVFSVSLLVGGLGVRAMASGVTDSLQKCEVRIDTNVATIAGLAAETAAYHSEQLRSNSRIENSLERLEKQIALLARAGMRVTP